MSLVLKTDWGSKDKLLELWGLQTEQAEGQKSEG